MVTLTAAADSWKSWLDDAPLPETFNSATGGLQDFITALSRALLTARAELDTTQTQLGDWIVRADEANVKVETLDAELARVKADAQAAVALVVERAAERLDINRAHLNFEALLYLLRDKTLPEPVVTALSDWLDVIAAAIRALTPVDGLAMVQELRAEMDTLAAENASLKAAKAVAG